MCLLCTFFKVPGIPGVFIDPQEIYISLELNLLKTAADGPKKIGEDPVALEQVPLYTIFKVRFLRSIFFGPNTYNNIGYYDIFQSRRSRKFTRKLSL